MKNLLLHSCCGPCSTVVIERLKERFNVTIFYYNPNIEPFEEYERRKTEQKKVCEFWGVNIIDGDYDNSKWRDCVSSLKDEPEGGARCEKCFVFRLKKTAQKAKELGFDVFATTLSVSPHKNSNVINAVGEMIAKEENIEFLQENFKKQNGYLRSIQISKDLNLYRQNYCGCEFSNWNLKKKDL